MRTIPKARDAFGLEMLACLNGGDPYEIVERDDGFISAAHSIGNYFQDFRHWPERQRQAARSARGSRALDVGAGAGRVSLFLQRKGFRVTAIDSSPGAIRICQKRGVKDARLLPFEEVHRLAKHSFDTVVMFGNNFGLFGSRAKAGRLLRRLHALTSEDAVILAETLNPYKTNNPEHLRYQRLNRKRGRMSGQIRIRIRFEKCVGPWFDYLFVSPDEMRTILRGTGWKVRQIVADGSPIYVAIIEKA